MKEITEYALRFRLNNTVHPEDLIHDTNIFPIEKSSVPQITADQLVRTVINNASQLEIVIQLNGLPDRPDLPDGVVIKLCSGKAQDLLTFAARLSFAYPMICEDMINEGDTNDQESFTVKMGSALLRQLDEIIRHQNMFLLNSEDPEILHQLRIRLRQMRSYLWCLASLMNIIEVDLWRLNLKEIMELTTQLRESDVLLYQCTELYGKGFEDECISSALSTEFTRKRKVAAEEVKIQLLNGILTPTLLSLRHGLMLTHWESDESAVVKIKVIELLRKRYDRVRNSLKILDPAKTPDVHLLRIDAKKLHYSLLLLEPMMPKKIDPVIVELKSLQDQLGHLCDLAKNRSLLRSICENSSDRSIVYECGRMEGYLAAEQQYSIRKYEKIKLSKSIKKQWLK